MVLRGIARRAEASDDDGEAQLALERPHWGGPVDIELSTARATPLERAQHAVGRRENDSS